MTPNTRAQRFEVLKNGTFVIRKVQPQDRGQYVCTAKNLHGADRMAVLLAVTVQQPQILASHYQDVTVYLGDTIAMECLAKGTPAPQISWIFPDRRVWQHVSPAEGRVTLHENRTLSIKEASFADRGVYKCVASNAAGADSLAIRLHVAALPPVIQQEKLENISLPPGLSIHIHCSAKAAPLPSVRWVLGDGSHIRPSQFLRGNLFVFPNGTLYIRNLAPKDSGRYECVAANLVGTARRTVQLTVRRAAANARITGTSPQRTNVHYGGTLRLDCSASGDPWPRILWRLPSKRMIDSLFRYGRPPPPRPCSRPASPQPARAQPLDWGPARASPSSAGGASPRRVLVRPCPGWRSAGVARRARWPRSDCSSHLKIWFPPPSTPVLPPTPPNEPKSFFFFFGSVLFIYSFLKILSVYL